MGDPRGPGDQITGGDGLQTADPRARRRRFIKLFWLWAGDHPAIGRETADAPARDPSLSLRVGGISAELPRDEGEWDLHVAWKRMEQEQEPGIARESGQELATILARARYAMKSSLIRRWFQRRGLPGTDEAGRTKIEGSTERTKSRRSSKAA